MGDEQGVGVMLHSRFQPCHLEKEVKVSVHVCTFPFLVKYDMGIIRKLFLSTFITWHDDIMSHCLFGNNTRWVSFGSKF